MREWSNRLPISRIPQLAGYKAATERLSQCAAPRAARQTAPAASSRTIAFIRSADGQLSDNIINIAAALNNVHRAVHILTMRAVGGAQCMPCH